MAHQSTVTSSDNSTKSSSTVPKQKKKSNSTLTQQVSKHTKVNLKRGKLPINWTSYVENTNTGSKTVNKKYPKSITQLGSSRHDQDTNKSNVNMAPSICSAAKPSTGRCVAMDCEMVGIGDGRENMLARVSIVDENGSVLYDTFVKPQQYVTDYRTAVSGVRPLDMATGRDFHLVQTEVYHIIKGKLLIGHALRNDLKVLYLSHPKKLIRDTSKYKKFRDESLGRTPSLKFLSSHLLGVQIQHGEHSSIEDARATMLLYAKYRNNWESDLRTRFYKNQ